MSDIESDGESWIECECELECECEREFGSEVESEREFGSEREIGSEREVEFGSESEGESESERESEREFGSEFGSESERESEVERERESEGEREVESEVEREGERERESEGEREVESERESEIGTASNRPRRLTRCPESRPLSACASPGCDRPASVRCLGYDCGTGLCAICDGDAGVKYHCPGCRETSSGGILCVNTAPTRTLVYLMWAIGDREYMRTEDGRPCAVSLARGGLPKDAQRTNYYFAFTETAPCRPVQVETARATKPPGRLRKQMSELGTVRYLCPKIADVRAQCLSFFEGKEPTGSCAVVEIFPRTKQTREIPAA